MPVTTYPAAHNANKIQSGGVNSAEQMLKECCPNNFESCKQLLQSSFATKMIQRETVATSNGFVNAAITAYNNHHHLTIRPEDVWISILAQFSHYVNANAEQLRSKFVAHEGKKELEVTDGATIFGYDFQRFIRMMNDMITENIVDPELREWILPSFTTTTETDRIVAAVMMMGTLQKFFDFKLNMMCGLPSVTLLGEKSDWEDILLRLERLKTYGKQCIQWYQLLVPVIKRFIQTFDAPHSSSTRDFWQKISHYTSNGSGPTWYSGWITAFCFWDGEGRSHHRNWFDQHPKEKGLILDGVAYHRIDSQAVPPGFVSVPVLVNGNGTEYNTKLIAGSVGYNVSSSSCNPSYLNPNGTSTAAPQKPDVAASTTNKAKALLKSYCFPSSFFPSSSNPSYPPEKPTLSEIDAQAGEMDSVQPCIGWWCFISKSDEEMEKAVVEKYRAWGFEGPGDGRLASG